MSLDSINFASRVGTKYYRIVDDKVEIYRILRHRNMDTVVLVDDNEFTADPVKASQNVINIKVEDLIHDYRMILPNGQLVMMIVTTESGMLDVCLLANKVETSKDMEENAIQFGDICLICRQFLLDFFATITSDKKVVGVSVTRDNCPSNISFDLLISGCEPVDKQSQMISIYAQDSLDAILCLLKTKAADRVLENNFNESLKSPEKVLGVVDSVRSLMTTNSFIQDLWSIFGITPINNIKVKFDEENNSFVLTNFEVHRIEYALKQRMSDILILRYDHFIDEDKLAAPYSYAKIRDDNGKFYIIQFMAEEGFDPSLYPEEVQDGLIDPTNNKILI